MNQYFSKITSDHWTAKNKLQAAAKEVARKMDGILINENKQIEFINQFKEEILRINNKFYKCKPMVLHNHPCHSNSKEHFIYINCVFEMKLYLVKGYLPEKTNS